MLPGRHIAVMFGNIGTYHAARLRAAASAAAEEGWRLTAVQVTDNSLQHAWGDLRDQITFPVVTVLPLTSQSRTDAERVVERIDPHLVSSCLDRLAPDAVAIPGWGFRAAQAALTWCRQRGAAAILMSETKHDDEPRRWWKERAKWWMYVRHFRAALVGGRSHRDYLVQLGFPSERIFTGYDVVDNDYIARTADQARGDPSAAQARQPKLPRRPYFLVLTRFLPRKNLAILIEAYAAYHAALGPAAWELAICGDGPEYDRIMRAVRLNALENSVHLPGFVPYAALGDWYGLAEAFVHTAQHEPWGLVINEACAAGLPIICSRSVGAARELVQERENGMLFDPGDAAELTRLLLSMHSKDPTQRGAMGRASRRAVDPFRPGAFGSGLMAALHSAARSAGS